MYRFYNLLLKLLLRYATDFQSTVPFLILICDCLSRLSRHHDYIIWLLTTVTMMLLLLSGSFIFLIRWTILWLFTRFYVLTYSHIDHGILTRKAWDFEGLQATDLLISRLKSVVHRIWRAEHFCLLGSLQGRAAHFPLNVNFDFGRRLSLKIHLLLICAIQLMVVDVYWLFWTVRCLKWLCMALVVFIAR